MQMISLRRLSGMVVTYINHGLGVHLVATWRFLPWPEPIPGGGLSIPGDPEWKQLVEIWRGQDR